MSIDTLINSPQAFVSYNAQLYFTKDNDALSKLKMLEDTRIMKLISELKNWPGKVFSSHKSAHQPFHKLAFLADIGLSIDDNEIYSIIKKILERRNEQGIPQLPINIGTSYGGSGKDTWAWALCDAPTVFYGLIKMGYRSNTIDKAVRILVNLVRENGWGCSVSKELGTWRGPGKKNDPCPYATLIMIKLLLQYKDEYKNEISIGCNSLNKLWENSLNDHPYIFYMGTDFRKLKLPFIWYDILHVVDVLSQAKKTKMNTSLEDMIKIIRDKTDHGNICRPESEYRYWKDWDFGQKKMHSEWMEFCIRRIFSRVTKVNCI
jgi:hypothetical protein